MKRSPTRFAVLLQNFFCEHLVQQKNVSPKTVTTYRDAFRLFLRYMEQIHRKSPVQIDLPDFTADTVLGFLNYLEKERQNTVRSRNLRLAALRSFAHFVLAFHGTDYAPQIQRILSIPLKRFARPLLGFLSPQEMQALLDTPDATTRAGRRDRLLFQLLYNTGARISEIIHLRVEDVSARDFHVVQLRGKGRKQRTVPLWKTTRRLLRQWVANNALKPDQPLLGNRFGHDLSRSGVAFRLEHALTRAAQRCPSLRGRTVTPHSFRHSTAMCMLQAGVAPEVIALWLGHESPTTTHLYIEANIAMKEKALNEIQSPSTRGTRFLPKDDLLRFLDDLQIMPSCGSTRS
jgi:integrase/recombinase XerD